MQTEFRCSPNQTKLAAGWLNLLAVSVCLYGLLIAAAAWVASRLRIMAPPRGPWESFIDRQEAAVAVWALSTAVAAVVMRLWPRLAPLMVGVWAAMLVRSQPWRWPSSLESHRRHPEATIWRDHWVLLGALVLLSLVYGGTMGWQRDGRARVFALVTVAMVLSLLAVSAVLVLRAQAVVA